MDQASNVFTWPVFPFPALISASGAAIVALAIIVAAHFFDRTGGLLTLSIIIVVAFISTTFISLIYTIQQSPLSEILVGALSTSVGAIIAYWCSYRGRPGGKDDE